MNTHTVHDDDWSPAPKTLPRRASHALTSRMTPRMPGHQPVSSPLPRRLKHQYCAGVPSMTVARLITIHSSSSKGSPSFSTRSLSTSNFCKRNAERVGECCGHRLKQHASQADLHASCKAFQFWWPCVVGLPPSPCTCWMQSG